MHPCFQDHLGAAKYGLGGELGRDIARQSGSHSAIAQGFNCNVDISWATATQAGDCVQQGFFNLKREPTADSSFCAIASSAAVAFVPSAKADADAPTNAGVFGITRIRRLSGPKRASSLASVTPAAM